MIQMAKHTTHSKQKTQTSQVKNDWVVDLHRTVNDSMMSGLHLLEKAGFSFRLLSYKPPDKLPWIGVKHNCAIIPIIRPICPCKKKPLIKVGPESLKQREFHLRYFSGQVDKKSISAKTCFNNIT